MNKPQIKYTQDRLHFSVGGCLAYHETRLFKKNVSGWVPAAGSSPNCSRALLFSFRVPLSLQLTRHWGQLVRSTQGMFPHSFCYSGDKKRKIETPEGPGNNFTRELSANVVSGSWEGFHVPPLKVKGQCAHLRWRKVIVGAALRASCQASIWESNC